ECPADRTVECTSASGATVTYSVSATDGCDATPTVACQPPSGSLFAFGPTQVCCTATDDSRNSSRCCFQITVVDSQGPVIHCPSDQTLECTGPNGAIGTFTVTATDVCDPNPTIVCTPPSGSNFAFGPTRVCCTTTDDHQLTSRCYFRITVVDTTPPSI